MGFICSPLHLAELRIVLILVILSLKNLPKELAKVVGSEQSGNGLDWDLWRMRLILLHNFLGLFLFLEIVSVYQSILAPAKSLLKR